MSTQRREDGSTPATKSHRGVPRNRWQRRSCTDRADGLSRIWLGFVAWFARAIATVGTAPPEETAGFLQDWAATNSLQSDHSTTQLVRQDFRRISRSAPPHRAGLSALTGTPATRRSSVPLTPSTAVLVSVRPSWPNHPAGQCRWTERYDGQRNLHFLYAA